MIVENKSNKIVGIGLNVTLLPGEKAVVPQRYEKNPIVLRDIKKGRLEVIEEAEDNNSQTDAAAGEEKQDNAAKALEDMSVEELAAYAGEKGIDIGKATSKEGILNKIEAALGA